MKKSKHKQVKTLIDKLILPFYLVERDMGVPTANGDWREENDAEHSWSLAVLACSLAPHIDPDLDIGLVSQFALVHDLVELHAQDTTVWASDRELEAKEEKEAQALKKIMKDFGEFPWLVETLEAYERQEAKEALYVRTIDKYIALMIRFTDGGRFYKQVGITKEKFDKNLVIHRKKAQGHPGAAEYYEMIRAEYDAHPEHFARS